MRFESDTSTVPLSGGVLGFTGDPTAATSPPRTRTASLDAVLRRADVAFDAVATILAYLVVGQIDARAVVPVLAIHFLLALSRNQPPPFRLEQFVQSGRIGAATLISVGAYGAVFGWHAGELAQVATATAAMCVTGRSGYVGVLRWARREGLLAERAIIVGNSLERLGLRQACTQHREYGIDVIGEMKTTELKEALHGSFEHVPPAEQPTAVVVARGVPLTGEVLSELQWAVTRGYRVLIETARADQSVPAGEVVDMASARIVCLPLAPLTYRSWLLKRSFDLVVSSTLLALFAPLMALVAVGVKLSSPGPVIFRQQRVGRDRQPFTMLKFRTFPVDHVDDAFSLAHGDCPLRFGRFLRRTSLDELPQLWNVLCGEMSIVGPRPERVHFVNDLGATIPGYDERHRVPGGITGLAQVNGYWGDTNVAERVHHDNVYIDTWRPLQDFTILLRTLPATIRKGLS